MAKKTKSEMGYRDDSPYRDEPFIDINTPSGQIDMSNSGRRLKATDGQGNTKILEPYSGMHQFEPGIVREEPVDFEEMELTDEEIEEYRRGGYVVEEMQDGGTFKPAYVQSKSDPRYRAYQDSLSLKKLSDQYRNYLDNPQRTTKAGYKEASDWGRGLPEWSFDEEAYNKDKRANKVKDFNSYMYDIHTQDKQYEENIGHHFKTLDKPKEVKLSDGRIKQYYEMQREDVNSPFKIDKERYTIHDPVVGSRASYTQLEGDSPHLSYLYHPYITPERIEYYRESGPKVTQTYDISSLNEHREDDKLVFKNSSNKKYENKDWWAQSKNIYRSPIQPYIVDPIKGEPYTGPANIFEAQGLTRASSKPKGTTDPKLSVAVNLRKRGMDSSFKARKAMAEEAGITDYKGTKDQNIALNEYVFANYEGDKKKVTEEPRGEHKPLVGPSGMPPLSDLKKIREVAATIDPTAPEEVKERMRKGDVPHVTTFTQKWDPKTKKYIQTPVTQGIAQADANRYRQKGGEYQDLELTDEEIAEYKAGGYVVEELPQAQNGIQPAPRIEPNWLQSIERNVNEYLDYPQRTARNIAQSYAPKGDDPVDNIRHPVAGMKTTQALMDKGVPTQLAVLAANAMGVGHEAAGIFKDKRPWGVKLRESAEDIYNNAVGSGMALTEGTNREKINKLVDLSFQNKLPDGYGGLPDGKNMYFKQEGGNVKYNTPEYNKAYEEGTVMRYDRSTDTFQGQNLPEFTITEEDPRVLDAMRNTQSKFLQRAFEAPGQPQKQMVEWMTGTQQTPSEAWPTGHWASDFALDAVTDPTNLIGASAANRALKLGKYLKPVGRELKHFGKDLGNHASYYFRPWKDKPTSATEKLIAKLEGEYEKELGERINSKLDPHIKKTTVGTQPLLNKVENFPNKQYKKLNDILQDNITDDGGISNFISDAKDAGFKDNVLTDYLTDVMSIKTKGDVNFLGELKPYQHKPTGSSEWAEQVMKDQIRSGTVPDDLQGPRLRELTKRYNEIQKLKSEGVGGADKALKSIEKKMSEIPRDHTIEQGNPFTGSDAFQKITHNATWPETTFNIDKWKIKKADPEIWGKEMQELEELQSVFAQKYSGPDMERRFANIGILPKDMPTKPPKLTFNSDPFMGGSHYNLADNVINIDFDQIEKLKKLGYDITPKRIYEHELGHYFQNIATKQHPQYKKVMKEYDDAVDAYDTMVSEFGQDKIKQFPGSKPIKPIHNIVQTPLDTYAKSINRRQTTGKPLTDEFKRAIKNYKYFKHDVEPLPHIRETRQAMIDKGYLKSIEDKVTIEKILNYITDNPNDRIATFINPTERDLGKLKHIMNAAPAAVPIAIGAGLVNEQLGGEYEEMELSDAEIAQMRAQGIRVDEL